MIDNSSLYKIHLLNRNNKAWYNIHNYPVNIHNFSIFRKFYENIMDYLISKSINGIITVSKSCKKEFNKRPMIDESLIHYIHNGFDNNTFYYKSLLPKKISNYNKDSKIIFFPSVIEKRKGHKNIIKAMDIIVKNNKNIHLIICGEGDLKEESELNYLINNSLSKNNIHLQAKFLLIIIYRI